MRKKGNKSSLGILVVLALIIGGIIYLFNSSMFERDPVQISLETNGYWNMKEPLELKMDDVSGVKSYKVSLELSGSTQELLFEQFIEPRKSLEVKVHQPKSAYAIKDKTVTVVVEAQDASKWDFFNGNSIVKKYKLVIDKKRPQVSVLSNSYKIMKGGAAIVVFKAQDENLKDIYIQTNFNKKFQVTPFYKEGYYISLLAWPVKSENFRADIITTDLAGNEAKTYVPLYLKNKSYRVSNIKVTDRFLKGKIADLAERFEVTQGVENSLEQFKLINENVREKNEKLIHEITSKVPTTMIDNFRVHKMYPLKNAKVVASFGDHRKYFYDDTKISESYHLGLDLASNAMAKIKPQNGGKVVFADFNGLYGNMPIIHHGLGLYTLYGHCSSLHISNGDTVTAGEEIANTGKSGYAMGDHLHFGVLIQGIEVRPQEWMDKRWIKLNITSVIDSAKKIIDRS